MLCELQVRKSCHVLEAKDEVWCVLYVQWYAVCHLCGSCVMHVGCWDGCSMRSIFWRVCAIMLLRVLEVVGSESCF